jgi:hypothetical protein
VIYWGQLDAVDGEDCVVVVGTKDEAGVAEGSGQSKTGMLEGSDSFDRYLNCDMPVPHAEQLASANKMLPLP